MRVYRLLVETTAGLWTFIVAAGDHEEAWRLVRAELPRAEARRATLEELEATGERCATGKAGVLHAWSRARNTRRRRADDASGSGLAPLGKR